MSQEPEIVRPPTAKPPRRRRLAGAIVAGALLAALLGLWLYHRVPRLQPPLPDLTGVDPEVAAAITEARRDVLQQPSSEQSWGHLGMVLTAHRFLLEANVCFAQAERLNPREPRWPYLQGVNLLWADPDAGIACLERAVAQGGEASLTPRLRLAEALLDRGRLDEAEQQLQQARALAPNKPRVRFDLGLLASLRGEWGKALEQLGPCRDDIHTRKLAHRLSAQALRRLHEEKQAEAESRRAEELAEDEEWPDAYTDAVRKLQCGLQARIKQADELVKAGQPMPALRLMEETAEKYPDSLKTWLGLGGLWLQLGQTDRAEQAFRKAVAVDPGATEGWFRLGCIQAVDRPREAVESFRRVIRLRPDYTLAHFNLGHRLKQLGDRAGAAEEFRAALRCRPDFAEARQALQELERSH